MRLQRARVQALILMAGSLAAAILPTSFTDLCYAESKEAAPMDVVCPSSVDGEDQRMKLYVPPGAKPDGDGPPVPLVVSLHSWSAGYAAYDAYKPTLAECRARGWVFLSPDFRGPNVRPEACASDMAMQDVLDAVAFARQQARIDATRIYLLGGSGGGHMALMMACKAPDLWAAVSTWVPVTDLAAWHRFCTEQDYVYAGRIEKCMQGPPGDAARDREYRKRSPLFFLEQAKGIPIDIQTGIHDGHGGRAIPVDHSLRAFNALVEANGHGNARLSDADIASLTSEAHVPTHLTDECEDEAGREHPVLFRRSAGPVRLTLFDGGHVIDPAAGLNWLAAQWKATKESATVSLDGEWDFTWTPATADAIPPLPVSEMFDAKVRVPGKLDDQWDRLKESAWWEDAVFATAQGPVQYLSGIGWYRTRFQAPADWEGRAVRLTVGWAVGQMNVWVNGRHVDTFDYGVYVPNTVDVSGHLAPGETNEIIVSVDNTHGFAGGWAFLGDAGKASAISRPVTLDVAASHAFIQDLYIRPGADLKEAVWDTELTVASNSKDPGPSRIAWRIVTSDGREELAHGEIAVPAFKETTRVPASARIPAIKPWSPRHPNLYWIELEWRADDGNTLLDTHRQRFGLRRWSHDGRKLLLNGTPFYLCGEFGAYCFPVDGTTPTDKAYWIDHVARAKEVGMNYINFAARVCPVELMEAADELGIVLQCGDHMTVLKEHRDHYEDVWTPIVRLTRQYPSMGFYGFGGERDYYDGAIDQFQKQYDLIKALHPESMVMPQQAIRGIDYAFTDEEKTELTKDPFPHHAERLVQYTKACDLFGHYSGGGFGYNYFGDPWRMLEKRFRIYDKPLVMHELFMGMSYLSPHNAQRYTGRIPPYLYTQLEKDLTAAGLFDRWPVYHANSSKLQGICKKYCIEKARKCDELAGFEYLGMTDMHFCAHYTVGILDEFKQLKPGDTVEGIRRYNSDSVLLIDFAGDSINRSFWSGDAFRADLMVSLFGETGIETGRLTWTLRDGEHVVLDGGLDLVDVANGRVSTLETLDIHWPSVDETTRLNLEIHLTAPGYDLTNDWDFWVFPKVAPPRFEADADDAVRVLLGSRYEELSPLTDAADRPLRIVSEVTERDLTHLTRGGDVLLLGAKPFNEYTQWRSFRPGLGAREHHNVGTVIAQHPIFSALPHDGWGDWQFYPVLEGATCILFDDALTTPFDPILEIISSAEHVRKHAAIMEKRVGNGRLLVSTCEYDAANPACVALMDGILAYVTGDVFAPASDLSPAVLERLIAPPEAAVATNLVAVPGFETPTLIPDAWQTYGTPYEIDEGAAHTGSASLKIAIAPDHAAANPNGHTGAMAKAIQFTHPPKEIRLSAWHKTDALTGDKGRDFLLFAYVRYANGKQHTLRLFLEPGTHDWELAETTWKPEGDVTQATLYIGLARRTGTAWIDDVYFGAAPANEKGGQSTPEESLHKWHSEPVKVDFGQKSSYRVNGGPWQTGTHVDVTQEGLTSVDFKAASSGDAYETKTVRIDTAPPVIVLTTEPILEQEGGVYFAGTDTVFTFEGRDALSGVEGIEMSVDGSSYTPYLRPMSLPLGQHVLRCRATDRAGNQTEVITGPELTGGETTTLHVTVR
ncbi:MAG: prolyl oligopeptidase family serine peptidase [bacterium]|nr:prolyl oligopeptidase family serine peptidase [bacterium]